jgi:tetratricopeptide (TPR) repeat protein
MTNQVDLFADETDRPTGAQATSAPARTAAPAKKRRSALSDPVIYWMLVGFVAIVILWVAAISSAIVFGLLNPPAPRTYVERQLYLLDGVVRTTPGSTKAWADYASALIAAKQYSKASQVIERGLKTAPEKSLITVQKAKLALAKGQKDKALTIAEEAAKLAREEREVDSRMLAGTGSKSRLAPKGLPGALVIIGDIRAERKEWEAVVKTWTEYLTIEPTDCAALVDRARAYVELGKDKKAEKDYRQALKFIPDMPEALAGLKAIGASEK